ncbi:MAG: cytidine deaminase [Candidatus Cryptobacteroides sp.]|nr:cytidine deaminase [Candidatus Cryptobacteroides sp.]
MTDRKLEIRYREYGSVEDLAPEDKELALSAIEAQKSSYAPYSKFNVGAAVRLADGSIVKGSNQENAATPSGLCAERTAMFAASAAHPGVPMVSLAIVGGPGYTICDEPATPCGSCRQVMAEYQKVGGRPIGIILVGKDKIMQFDKVDDVLPFIFTSLD